MCYLLSGAFSKVYQAIKLSTNEKVGIKIVRKLELNNQQVKRSLHICIKRIVLGISHMHLTK